MDPLNQQAVGTKVRLLQEVQVIVPFPHNSLQPNTEVTIRSKYGVYLYIQVGDKEVSINGSLVTEYEIIPEVDHA